MDYEAWLEQELGEAQAEVLRIQGLIASIQKWRSSNPGSPIVAIPATNNARAEAPIKTAAAPTTTRARGSKNQPIFDAFEAAGPVGLSQQEVLEVAKQHGLLTNTDALRALCWSAKKDGRLISIAPGRYAIAPRNEAAVDNSTKGETAASADHNRHREGDAGGGT